MFYNNLRLRRGPTTNKHGNKKVIVDGMKFDSQREYTRYCVLKNEERLGIIADLNRQIPFILAPSVKLNGRTKPAIKYWADFVYYRNRERVVEDSKSPHLRKNPVYRIKKHLMMAVHSIEIQEV